MTREQMIELKEGYLSLALAMEEMISIQDRLDKDEDVSEDELNIIAGKIAMTTMSLANMSI